MSVPKDGVAANTHFLNLLPNGASVPPVDRIPLYEVYMRMAEELAKRSTCVRLQVGTVVTDQLLENVLAIGDHRAYLQPHAGRPLRQRSEEHTSELQSRFDLVCRLLLEKKNK